MLVLRLDRRSKVRKLKILIQWLVLCGWCSLFECPSILCPYYILFSQLIYRCKKNFDYSDHLVLLLTHFITVAALELTYALHASNLQPMSKYSATILSAVGISLLAYRTLLFTGMFFHTTYENLVGLGLYILLIQLPLWALSGTRLFRSMFI